MLETREKIEKVSSNNNKKKNPDGNFRNEEYNNPNENPMDKLHSRVAMTKERMSDLENRMMEITQYEQQEKNRLKKTPRETQGPVGLL